MLLPGFWENPPSFHMRLQSWCNDAGFQLELFLGVMSESFCTHNISGRFLTSYDEVVPYATMQTNVHWPSDLRHEIGGLFQKLAFVKHFLISLIDRDACVLMGTSFSASSGNYGARLKSGTCPAHLPPTCQQSVRDLQAYCNLSEWPKPAAAVLLCNRNPQKRWKKEMKRPKHDTLKSKYCDRNKHPWGER